MATLSFRNLFLECGLRSLSIICGRLDVFARIESPEHRWAWLAFVKEGPSVEFIMGPATVTVSWGVGAAEDQARVWAWRRSRRVAPAAEAGEG